MGSGKISQFTPQIIQPPISQLDSDIQTESVKHADSHILSPLTKSGMQSLEAEAKQNAKASRRSPGNTAAWAVGAAGIATLTAGKAIVKKSWWTGVGLLVGGIIAGVGGLMTLATKKSMPSTHLQESATNPPSERARKELTGLNNPAVDCYANASLQLLRSLGPELKELLDKEPQPDLTRRNVPSGWLAKAIRSALFRSANLPYKQLIAGCNSGHC